MKRRIEQLKGHVILYGYGHNGKQAFMELNEHEIPVIIIEKDAEVIERLRDSDLL